MMGESHMKKSASLTESMKSVHCPCIFTCNKFAFLCSQKAKPLCGFPADNHFACARRTPCSISILWRRSSAPRELRESQCFLLSACSPRSATECGLFFRGMEFGSPAAGSGTASDDLLGLDLFGVNTSSASTPTGSAFAFSSNFTSPNASESRFFSTIS